MRKIQILVVEDEGLIAKDIQSMLRRLGYEVPLTVGTGDLAIQAAVSNQPDLILMDINLRGKMDGVMAADAIHAILDVPIVYLTANSDEATLQRAKVTDPFGFLIKPFEERSIQAGIEIALYRHKTEKQKREREQWLSTTLKSIADAVVTTDAGGKVTFLNCVAESLTGWTNQEATGLHYREVFPIVAEVSGEVPPDAIAAALLHGISKTGINHTLLGDRSGAKRHIEHSVAPIRREDDKVIGCVLVFRDISEQRQLEAEFRQSQKMEAIGKLAGSIAHDFNNAITTVMGYSSMLMSQLCPESQMHADAGQILRAAEHSARLTRQLLLFSRKQISHAVCLDLSAAVKEVQGLLRRLIRENVALEVRTAPEPWTIKADPGHVEQLVINLAVNARDAMPQGGRLSVKTMNATLTKEGAAAVRGAREGEFVCLEISDTGVGMSAELVQRIFEPFFTTKGPDKGTGLGLSTCEGIVRQAEGFISVDSTPGVGTTFAIYFPRTMEVPELAGEADAGSGTPGAGTETVLIVEDEEVLRLLAVRMLEELGYKVLEAANGFEALKLLGARGCPVDLIVTDMIMPEMSGRELIERVRSRGIASLVLFMSGYTEDDLLIEGLSGTETAFLQKPFTSERLTRKVRETIDAGCVEKSVALC